MKKVWLVFIYEYLHHVRTKRFLFALLSMPVLFVGMVVLSFVLALVQIDHSPVAYVDQSSWLADPLVLESQKGLFKEPDIIRYQDVEAARADLSAKKLQAVFVVESDYLTSGKVTMYTREAKMSEPDGRFIEFMRLNLLRDQPEAIRTRLIQGNDLQVVSVDDGHRQPGTQSILTYIMPFVVGILFIVVINISSGYLLQAVVEEKENRTMEILVTSISPNQLMAGKVAGNMSVGLTQLIVWMGMLIAAIAVVVAYIPWARNFEIPPGYILWSVLTVLPAFILVAAFMAMIGSTTTEEREAQQVAGLISLPIAMPFWFASIIVSHPNSWLPVGLSFFPLTAPLTLPLRIALTNVPLWQSLLSVGILFASAGFMVWLAGRAFRLGMLRYGKRLTWRELFGKG
jgi:ABC-2 type transport system permease protein